MIKIIDSLLHSRAFFWARLMQFALAIGIFTFAALAPAKYIPGSQPDYVLHFTGNLLLFLSASVACMGRMKLGLLVLMLVPYSLMIEIAQAWAPSRHVDFKDMLANMAGLAAGYVIAIVIEWCWTQMRRQAAGNS